MRAWLLSMAAAGAVACGDNAFPEGDPLAPATDLTIIAHQDDDLLFMQPDLYEAVQRGNGLTVVYVTAGNGTRGIDLAEARNDGAMAAYSAITGEHDWSCGWLRLGTSELQHCRLARAKVSLIFLGYPDGGKEGTRPGSLLHLWEGKAHAVPTVARRSSTYDQTELIRVLADIIDATAPTTLHTLEVASTHGHDHSDHMMAGALAVLATARSIRTPELISYRGYDVASEPANTDPMLFDREIGVLGHYEACARGCAPCGDACAIDQIDDVHTRWLERRYAIGMRTAADGQLRLGDGCLTATTAGGDAAIGACAGAPTWHLDAHGRLRASTGLCLQVIFSGEIIAGGCRDLGPGGRFFLDDEGHLWSGITPEPADDMTLAHLTCVGATGGRPRAELCGADHAPAVQLVRTTTVTPRAATTLTRTGRAVRIARLTRAPLPMVCAIETGTRGLMCAPGSTGGGLLPAVRIDSAAAPLAIEPESLTFGDVDGDGLTDACGRDAGGILCATAASGYRPVRWSTALAAVGPATATDRSLAIAPDGTICGLDAPGVVCVSPGGAAIDVRSTWPDRSAALWIADLDGDHQPDWCAATPDGPACSLATDRELTTAGVPWGYAFGGQVQASMADGALPDTATAVFTDIDGDGRDDLCTAQAGVIACARSLGRGFGPRTPIAALPAGMIPTALWAEPSGVAHLGRAPRICTADATTIACAD
jgi:LmbE family N-acetylglucosaminyl deacetylase